MQENSGSLNEVFVDVAVECYRRVQQLKESEDARYVEVAERAIEMALFGQRQLKEERLLLGDVLRNATFSVRRSQARRAAVVEEVGRLAKQNIVTGASGGVTDCETPEDVVLARELKLCLHDEACRCGAHGERVLQGLLEGESVRETAAGADVSTATVDRTVRRLRKAVVDAGYREAA
jgi:hypothetical protein